MGSLVKGLLGGGKSSSPSPRKVGNEYLGLVDAYTKGVNPLFSSMKEWTPEYNDLMAGEQARLAPGTLALLRTANPAQLALLDKIMSSATNADLDYGGGLPPGVLRQSQQFTRAGQAARGMGYGPSDLYRETGDATRLSTELTDRNRVFANRAAELSYNTLTDPFMRLLNSQVNAGKDAFLTPAGSLPLMQSVYNAKTQANFRNADLQQKKNEYLGDGIGSVIGAAAAFI